MSMLRLSWRKFAKRYAPMVCRILIPLTLMTVLVIIVPVLSRTSAESGMLLLNSTTFLLDMSACVIIIIFLAQRYINLKKTRLFWSDDLIIYATGIPYDSEVSDSAIIIGLDLPPEINMQACVNITDVSVNHEEIIVTGDVSTTTGSKSTEKKINSVITIPNVYDIGDAKQKEGF